MFVKAILALISVVAFFAVAMFLIIDRDVRLYEAAMERKAAKHEVMPERKATLSDLLAEQD